MLPYTDEQNRLIVNLHQQYEVWVEAKRAAMAVPHDRTTAAGRLADSAMVLDETCRLYRAVRLPQISSQSAAILRAADLHELLGTDLIVVGASAMPAYAIEAGARIDAPNLKSDLDFAWLAENGAEERLASFWATLRSIDSTFSVSTEQPFLVQNSRAYEVAFRITPAHAEKFPPSGEIRPLPLREQEWLRRGRTVHHVIVARDGSPARLVVPDPRWFALHKLWMSRQEERDISKRDKDAKQGHALLNAVAERMPQFTLDAGFAATLPPELVAIYVEWRPRASITPSVLPSWARRRR